jgi:hypothetical protein
MSTANVYNGNLSNSVWYTDKAEIVTGSNPVTYNVYVLSTVQPITIGGNTTNGANVLTTTAARPDMANATITGTNIPASTTVANITPGISLTLSANATGNVSNGVFTVTLPNPGNLYGNSNPQVAANSRQQIYVGAGNYLTITGGNSTAREIGTASSAQASVFSQG